MLICADQIILQLKIFRCLHAQQMGDFEIAIQSLYRFFDYCISVQDHVLYQYALLNLAMLHARFSNYDQALIVSASAHSVSCKRILTPTKCRLMRRILTLVTYIVIGPRGDNRDG